MSGAAIRITDVRVRYPQSPRFAIDGISLDIAAGEFVVLVGPSGCGKSTFLRTLNRLMPLDAGLVEIDGTDIATLDAVALRRTIGYAIQAVGLFAHMTVAQNIAIVPSLLHWERGRIDARVDELLELVRLNPQQYRDRRPRDLSGGEAQRVGVARAIAAEPRMLLMDEPFGAVDAIVRARLQDELLRIAQNLGTTTVFVTHDIDEALRLADRVVVMRGGTVEQIGAPLELLETPATPFVHQLVHANDAALELRARAIRAGNA